MRRKKGSLLSIELNILRTATNLRVRGTTEFHGFMIAKEMVEQERARQLTGHGTLYKALDRLREMGYLSSRWEDPLAAAAESRPRRRLYQVTVAGQRALAKAEAMQAESLPNAEKGLAPW